MLVNECVLNDIPDVTGIYKNIKITKIDAINDFKQHNTKGNISVEHRPIRESHVEKIENDFNGVIDPIKVIWSSKINKYLTVDGQHRFSAVMNLIDKKRIEPIKRYPCLVLHKKSTGERLDADNLDARTIANFVSYTSNAGQERECFSDVLYRVWTLGNLYKKENGTKHGMYEYVSKNGRGRVPKGTGSLRTYYGIANRLYKLNMWGIALVERERFGSQERVLSEIKKAEHGCLKEPITERITISIFKEVSDEANEHLNDAVYWTNKIRNR